MSYKRMTAREREAICTMLYVLKLNPEQIAYRLFRSPSTITREIGAGMRHGVYNPVVSGSLRCQARKRQAPHLKITDELWQIIKPKMERDRWSPEEVEIWMKNGYTKGGVCAKTMYNYIHYHMKGELKKLALKTLRRKGRKQKSGDEEKKLKHLKDITLIDERPEEINDRSVVGHWEGDLIIGSHHLSAILVTVERQKRYVMLNRLLSFDAYTVRKTIEERFSKLSPCYRRSITLDQGNENAQHKMLTENLNLKVYFCHPHSPWEKGTCENTNYLVRDMLYGLEDFRFLDPERLAWIEQSLNNRPRKTLGGLSPNEAFENSLR
jgi:IS30 family transposase